MAVTKIWRIRGKAGDPLSYVADPEKTQKEFTEEEQQALADVIAYAANEDKTDRLFYTTGVNCNVDFARDQFDTTKIRFGKPGGIVALHAYQSFREGEVTPDEAHAIGVELARELWGDRFQCVVATHLNTSCVHNHIVINSVSFRDGKKFHMCTQAYRDLRETSDRLCREHGLSIVENPRGRAVSQYLYKMEKAGMPTRYNVARQAIDEAVSLSVNMDEFRYEMKKRGFLLQFDPRRKHWTIIPPGWKKPIRLHQLGAEYTKERIRERVYDNDISVRAVRLRQQYHVPNNYTLKRRIDRIMGRSGLEKLYLRYCYELGYLPKYRQSPTKLHNALKEDLLKCDQYSEQAKLLSRYHISTEEELSAHQSETEEKIADITEKREQLRRKAKRVLPETEITRTKRQITELTSQLKALRREKKTFEQIRERSGHVREKLEIVDRDRNKQKRRKEVMRE